MSDNRSPLRKYSERIDAAVKRGLCYCDKDHLCKVHSDAFHAAYTEAVSDPKRWPGSVEKLIDRVRSEVKVGRAPPIPWPLGDWPEVEAPTDA